MKIIETRTKSDKVPVTVEVYCNKCATRLEHEKFPEDNKYYHGFNHYSAYGSVFDGKVHNFELCDKCYKKLIKSFKLPTLEYDGWL